ncbi:MAG TPA: hypothetical protein VF796_22135 [Humisphaera sp.]
MFVFWLVVGSAVVRGLVASRSKVQDLLLSPVVGFGVTLLTVFMVNRLGVPVIKFGPALGAGLLVLAVAGHVLMTRRARGRSLANATSAGTVGVEPRAAEGTAKPARFGFLLNPRHSLVAYLPFFLIVLLAAFLTGRPMLAWGFDWLSFCNDDMTNYCLAADRFLYYGFLEPPHTEAFVAGKDWTQAYWSLHIAAMVRPGSELAVAWVESVTGLNAHQAFMPTIVSFHLMLVSAAAGLVHRTDDRRGPALLAGLLVACSAQLTFGTVYQLIAQMVGLALLCTNLALVCRPLDVPWKRVAAHGLLAAIVLTTQLITYPEVNPFLAGGFFVFVAVAVVRRRLPLLRTAGVVAVGGAVTLVLLNSYLYEALAFMANQRKQAQAGGDVTITLFPFFLVPSGMSNFWGFTTLITQPYGDWWFIGMFNLSIAVGAVLLLLSLLAAAWLSWRNEPVAGMALVCLVLAVFLFRIDAGFGLYKLAMFAQPFVLGTLAVAWVAVTRRGRRRWLFPLILVLVIPSARIQNTYIGFSQDQGATFNEVPGATRTRLVQEFKREVVDDWAAKRAAEGKTPAFLCDAYNISLSKLLLLYTRGEATSVPASPFTLKAMVPGAPPESARPHVQAQAWELIAQTSRTVQSEPFEFVPEMPGANQALLWYVSAGGRRLDAPCDDPDTLLVATTPRTNLLNRRKFLRHAYDREGVLRVDRPEANFAVRPMRDVRNHLLFVSSDKSLPYFDVGDPTLISIYQLESDPSYFTRDTMAGVGPYLLFEVLNPDEEVRVCLDLTTSLKSDGDNRLPPAMAVGEWRAPMPFVGRGAGRVFSPPVRPRRINGRYYVGVDMGVTGKMFPSPRDFLLRWYGTRVAIDRRRLVGFARDVSVVGEDEYRRLDPPSAIGKWAHADSDLRHPDLEYAGFYEDGWMAEQGYAVLKAPAERTRLVVRGQVPGFAGASTFSTVLTILVDGRPVPFRAVQEAKAKPGTERLTNGPFTLTADLPPGPPGRRKVEIRSSDVNHLAAPDSRPAALQFSYIGLEAVKPEESIVSGK